MRDEISLRRFEWLIKQHGYRYEREEDIFSKISKRTKVPDFYVEPINNPPFLIEVESFEKPTALRGLKQVMSIAHMKLQKRINRAACHAAEQLEPYADLRLSLVIVLDNHRQVGLPLRPHDLVSLFGELCFTFKIATETGIMADEVEIEHKQDNSPFAGGKRPFQTANDKHIVYRNGGWQEFKGTDFPLL